MLTRLAIALGALLLAASAAAFLVPASENGSTCGNVVSPEFDRDEVRALVEDAEELSQDPSARFLADQQMDLLATSERLVEVTLACEDALSTRAWLGMGLLVGAIVVPAAVIFVGRGSRTVGAQS